MSSTVTGVDKITEAMREVSKTKFAVNFLDAFKKGDIKAAEEALQKLKDNLTNFTNEEKRNDYKVYLSGLETALNELKNNNGLKSLTADLDKAQ
jgi:hypothetical protein